MRKLIPLKAFACVFALASGFVGSAKSEVDTAKALAEVEKTPLSKGPNGETPSPASSVTLTPEEIAKIQGLKAKAAIVMHYAGNDWALAQVAGLKAQFAKNGH
jgi:ribose transport system substrate-binding protein